MRRMPRAHPSSLTSDRYLLADNTRAQKHLAYKPAVDFEKGLKRTVAWYRERGATSSVNA